MTCLTIDGAGVEEDVQQGVVDEASHLWDGAQSQRFQPKWKYICYMTIKPANYPLSPRLN